jgi:endonuclease III
MQWQICSKSGARPFQLHAHNWLILQGRYICIARKPKCPVCVIADICRYKLKTANLVKEQASFGG